MIRKTFRVILALIWIIMLTWIWLDIGHKVTDELGLKIGLTCAWIFVTWMGYELKHAKEMPEDFE
jgi:hypothetical protein